MVKASVRKPVVASKVTVSPPTQTASTAPKTAKPTQPDPTVVEAQVVEVAGEKVECVNTATPAAPAQEQDVTSIIPDTSPASTPEGQADQAPAAEEASTPEGQVPAVRQSYGAPTVAGQADDSGFDETDNKYPTLRIVAGSGKLSQMFLCGSLILGPTIDEAEQLFAPPDPKLRKGAALRFVPLALRKSWRENLTEEETQEGMQPRYFRTRQEVEEAGGTTAWLADQPPSFKPTATCIMLIEKPEGCDSPLFTTELDGKLWCPAVYYASNSAYKAFALPIHNSRRTLLQVPTLDAEGKAQKDARGFVLKHEYMPRYVWTLAVTQTVKKKDNREFTVFVPETRVLTKEETGPELRAFAEALVPTASTTDAE